MADTPELKWIKIPKKLQEILIDMEFIQKVESLAQKCFENTRYQEVYRLHNTWDNHVANILGYIADFCFETDLNLNKHEWTIMFAAAILHDVGKSLPCGHPSIDKKKIYEDAFVLKNLEDAHHVISFIVLKNLVDKKPLENLINENKIQKKGGSQLLGLITGFQKEMEISGSKEDWGKYLQCAAWISLRHKTLNEKLLHIFKPVLKDYLEKDSKPVDDETYEKEALNFFGKEIKYNKEIETLNSEFLKNNRERGGPDRFSILSALLQLGDKLDITKARIREDRLYLEVLLDDLVEKEFLQQINIQKQNQIGPQSLAKWYQYYYVNKIEIKKKSGDNKAGIDITIHYIYPECIKDDFLFIRSQLEKDFEDLGILSTLESALQEEKKDEEYRVTILRSENRTDPNEKPQRFIGLQRRSERLVYCLEKVCKRVPDKEYKVYIKKKLQGCLELTDAEVASILLCMEGGENVKPTPEKCKLFKQAEKIFQKDDGKASHPEWEKFSIKLPDNIRYLLCLDRRNNVNEKDVYKKAEEYRGKITDEKKVRLSLSQQALEGLVEWKEEASKKSKKVPQGKLFYPPDSKTRFIPTSLDVAILLNLFRHLRGESLTVGDIANISGLDRGRILKYCGWLEHEQYLLLDNKEETYKINLDPAKYAIVEKVLKEFDFQRSEMVSKIRDINRFGKPLALYSGFNRKSLKTHIKGLDRILSPFNEDMEGLPLRKSILLAGTPGSGKTTLALEIVRQVRLHRLPEETALYLTFEGDLQRIAEDNGPFGWKYQDISACIRSLSTLQTKTYLDDPDKFLKHFLNILDEFSPDFVAIDNLGYFLQLTPPEASREILNRLIRVLTVRGITSLLIGEDFPGGTGFELYDTDGVIYLHYKNGKRELEINKMRSREFAGGRHPFKIKGPSKKETSQKDKNDQDESDEPVIQVYPNIQMHLEIVQRKKKEEEKKKKEAEEKDSSKKKHDGETKLETKEGVGEGEEKQVLKSGIKGLDELLPIFSEKKDKKNGFEKGEIILVLGSPGAGKTLSGLHFLAEGYIKEDKKEKEQENVLWVSFESDLDGLKLATRSFSDKADVKKLYKRMNEIENKDKMFRFFPPGQLDPNELVNFLLEACDKNALQRIVLDSVNDIEQAFAMDMAFKSFMTSLVQLLREKGVTVMFLYRTRNFFGKSEDIGRTLTSVVDTIICLKVLEIQNAVQKGLFLLKVRGREHRSRLLSIEFKDDEGMSVLDHGWTMSGLISGEAGEIKEPRVSVKLFFENRNEFLINALIVSEYNRRFKGGQTTFVHVRKPQIYSEFWSFKGSSGAGHSNVRVVSLCDYWAVHFQRQDKLCDLGEYVSAAAYQLVYREEFWRRCAVYSFKKNAFEIFSIPNYVDIGVLAFHTNIKNLNNFWEATGLGSPQSIEDAGKQLARLTWNKLDATKPENSKIKDVVEELKNNISLRYLFAMPSLESKASFVSFFMEVYWSFDGVIFDLRDLFNKYAWRCYGFFEKRKKNHIDVEHLLFFKTVAIELTGDMAFIAEILMLIPERILNNAIRSMNAEFPNFLGDICRHGEVLLEKMLKDKEPSQSEKKSLSQIEKKSAITDIDKPLEAFFGIYPTEVQGKNVKNPIIDFIDKLIKELSNDEIWKKTWEINNGEQNVQSENLLSALRKTKKIVNSGINDEKTKGKENNEKHILIILHFVVSRIITNRERYQKLLEWRFKGIKKAKVSNQLTEIIKIGDKNPAAMETFEFLFQLVNSGIAPNPHWGDLTGQAYLARKWSGDVAPRPKLPPSKELISDLDLNMPPDAYEYKNNESDKTNYRIAPLPSYEQEKIDEKGTKKAEKWSCAVMGLWSLGITKPALSPEIGWIFIDALTENKFIELRAKRGLGLPAKASVYQRESIRKEQPEIYGFPDDEGNLKDGIVQHYELATQDKALKTPTGGLCSDGVYRRTRERVSIPYYYQIEEFLIKELSRFFEPSFFAILGKKGDVERKELIGTVLKRIHNRIKNFLISEFKLDEKESAPGTPTK